MNLRELTSLSVNAPLPAPYFVARLIGDPPGSFTVFSTHPEDVARSKNLHTVHFGPTGKLRAEKWAIMAYATSYAGLCGALDLLNVSWSGWCRIEGASW